MAQIPLQVSLSGSSNMSGSVLTKAHLSAHHLQAAIQFAESAGVLERAHSGKDHLNQEHRSFVIGSVMSTVAFVEAAINEFYVAVSDGDQWIDSLDVRTRQAVQRLWDQDI